MSRKAVKEKKIPKFVKFLDEVRVLSNKGRYSSSIEEVWKQKPRQTVVVVFWGKIAAHMASIKTV